MICQMFCSTTCNCVDEIAQLRSKYLSLGRTYTDATMLATISLLRGEIQQLRAELSQGHKKSVRRKKATRRYARK